jgi:hypothetical protein
MGTLNEGIIEILKNRFLKNPKRHQNIEWSEVEQRLKANPDKLRVLEMMESTGGEPDVVGKNGDAIVFYDCSPESPMGRRSTCYDPEALDARKEAKPGHSAVGMAKEMKVYILDEAQYRHLQSLSKFDTKTSSWLLTPHEIRKHGGAIFGDYRYEHIFIYHNGVQSYYAARGFRAGIDI